MRTDNLRQFYLEFYPDSSALSLAPLRTIFVTGRRGIVLPGGGTAAFMGPVADLVLTALPARNAPAGIYMVYVNLYDAHDDPTPTHSSWVSPPGAQRRPSKAKSPSRTRKTTPAGRSS